jgi:hypothetical protein
MRSSQSFTIVLQANVSKGEALATALLRHAIPYIMKPYDEVSPSPDMSSTIATSGRPALSRSAHSGAGERSFRGSLKPQEYGKGKGLTS